MAKAKSDSNVAVMDDTRQVIRFKFTGKRPLLMHNERLADPFNPITQAIKKITGKKKKTEEDLLEIFRLECMGSLYFSEAVGVHIPDLNILSMFVEAARLRKLGTTVERALDIADQEIPLIHDGPSNPEKLALDPDFRDIRGVVIAGRKTMRARPRFNRWALEFNLLFDPEQINREDVIMIAHDAGSKIGLCDFRPRFGRFSVEVLG